jgi:hypothetical protein
MEGMKQCRVCGLIRPLWEFNRSSKAKDGYDSRCKQCKTEQDGRVYKPKPPVPEGFKRCSKCNEVRPLEEFYLAASSKDGYRSDCKFCVATSAGWTHKPKEKLPEGLKRCKDCQEIFPATDEWFKKESRRKSGVASICKKCASNYSQQYYRENGEAVREYNRQRYHADRDNQREISRRWYQNNKQRHREVSKRWYEANYEYARELDRKRYQQNRDTLLERSRQWRKENYAQYRAYNQEWIQKNPEKAKAIAITRDSRRRARKRSLPNTFTPDDWRLALEYWDYRCAVCGRAEDESIAMAADHWIPLAHPDCPGTVPTNIIVLCDGKGGCNTSKSKQNAAKWLVEKLGEEKAREKLAEIEAYFEYVTNNSVKE